MTPSVWEVTVTGSGRTFLLVAALLLPITGAVGCAPMTQFVTPAPAAGPAAVAEQPPLTAPAAEAPPLPPPVPTVPAAPARPLFRPLPAVATSAFWPEPPPPPANYLAHSPVFDANVDPRSPRGLADQIVSLQARNDQLAMELGSLKQSVEGLQQELQAAREAASRAQQAWDHGQQELAAARSSLEDHQRQMSRALERFEESEQRYLDGLDDLIGTMQTTLRKWSDGVGE